MLTGVIVNTVAIIVGSGIGLIFRKGISERISETLVQGMMLGVLYIGISGLSKTQNVMVLMLSLAVGAIVGEGLMLEQRFEAFAHRMEGKISQEQSIAKGLIAATLLFCVGAMAVVGSLESGLQGNHTTLFAKAAIDGVVAITLAASLGMGVAISSIFVLLYEGAIVLSASLVAPFMTETVIGDMTGVGSLLIIAIGLNTLQVTKIKTLNILPGILIPVFYYLLLG